MPHGQAPGRWKPSGGPAGEHTVVRSTRASQRTYALALLAVLGGVVALIFVVLVVAK